MQKKLIALALASLAGSAFAQSNVTIYGVMDVTYDYVGARQSSGASEINMDGRVSTNSSYIGFKGSEDLGNGLKAVFQVETGVNGDTGGWGAGRDTFVGLSSSAGSVVLGRLTSGVRALGNKVDVNAGATGIGYQGTLFGQVNGVKTGVDERVSNAVAYISPNFAGFSGNVLWGAGSEGRDIAGTAAAPRSDNVYALGLNYENGPIYVGYGFHKEDFSGAKDIRTNRLGGYYKIGTMGQVGLLWDRTQTAAAENRDAWLVNGKLGLGAGNLIAGYGKARDVKGTSDTGATNYFVGYEHALSKRTILKAVYSEVKNESAAANNYYLGAVGGGGANALVAGNDPRGIQIGVRHAF